MVEWRRYTLTEYGAAKTLDVQISDDLDIPVDRVRQLLEKCAHRISSVLQINASPFEWIDRGIQFQNVAGVLTLAPQLEIEVAPKFLGISQGWREDFFLLTTLSLHGRLLDNEGIGSSSSVRSDLIELIADCFVSLYNQNRRRPLRSYRRLSQTEFALDGDFEPEQLSFPVVDGYDQEITTFTRKNSFNAVLRSAASRLATTVPSAEIRARLGNVIHQLPRQRLPIRERGKRLPNRARTWQPTYDLAIDVLNGFGGTFDLKNMVAPGFVVKTWQLWEDLVNICLRIGFGPQYVSVQSRYQLGSRISKGTEIRLHVVPDFVVVVECNEGRRRVVVDAKYKGSIDRSENGVSNSDIYEAFAFAKATEVHSVFLVYPMSLVNESLEYASAGSSFQREVVKVDDVTIHGIELGVRGISKSGRLESVADALKSSITNILNS